MTFWPRKAPFAYTIDSIPATASALFLCFLIAGLSSCSDGTDEIGTGSSADSPDGRFSAIATYFRTYTSDDEFSARYEFEITDAISGALLGSHAMPAGDSDPHISFRGGDGSITWNSESTVVEFGSDEMLLWAWSDSQSEKENSNLKRNSD